MNEKISITVFTSTYNRAYLLRRLYESLRRQTVVPCEWLVVDDGSTDDTKLVMEELIARGELNIVYRYKENGGKHRAINDGVRMAGGDLFFIVDSDDYLPERLSDRYQKIIRANPRGHACYFNQEQLYHAAFWHGLAKSYNYYYFSMLAGDSLAKAYRNDNRKILAPMGMALGCIKRRMRGGE